MARRRMTPAARKGLRAMAGYWLTGLESWGREFESCPRSAEELREINAGLAYLGLGQIDSGILEPDEEDEEL